MNNKIIKIWKININNFNNKVKYLVFWNHKTQIIVEINFYLQIPLKIKILNSIMDFNLIIQIQFKKISTLIKYKVKKDIIKEFNQ